MMKRSKEVQTFWLLILFGFSLVIFCCFIKQEGFTIRLRSETFVFSSEMLTSTIILVNFLLVGMHVPYIPTEQF